MLSEVVVGQAKPKDAPLTRQALERADTSPHTLADLAGCLSEYGRNRRRPLTVAGMKREVAKAAVERHERTMRERG